jgi:hypothetical protein
MLFFGFQDIYFPVLSAANGSLFRYFSMRAPERTIFIVGLQHLVIWWDGT